MRWLFLILCAGTSLFAEKQPEPPSGFAPKESALGYEFMVVSANTHASQAGFDVLSQGGNAMDALVAMQWVLNVVEPQSSGLGGGAFLLYYDKKTGEVIAFDGRETAPQGVNEKWFLDAKGEPLPMQQAMVGGRSVGVPGVLKMLEMAHQAHGILPWKNLFDPAIQWAEKGFLVSPRLNTLIRQTPGVSEAKSPYLFRNQTPLAIGDPLKNPELATTFRILAEQGSEPFYKGEIAQKIVQTVQAFGGVMTLEDLANYQAIKRKPIISTFGKYVIYGFPPPSSGGIAVAQIMSILEHANQWGTELGSTYFIELFSRASRYAFADRNYYVADPSFFPVPVERLLDDNYLRQRAASVLARERAEPGKYPGASVACCPPMILSAELELPSTSQLCVVDREGNCACMTSSIENAFGSTTMTAGFFLNNQLTDFSLVPEKEGKKAANRVEPGKRPMSSMSPTIVFNKEDLDHVYLTLGSSGGAWIIDYVAKALCGVLAFKLDIQEAVSFPNFAALDGPIDLEQNTFLTAKAPELELIGETVKIMPLTSGSQGIQRREGVWIGGVDPRREGKALGR